MRARDLLLIGRNAESLPALVKRAAADGHTIAHHSYSHPDKTLRLMSEDTAKADIDKGIAAVNKALGATAAPFFRFPRLRRHARARRRPHGARLHDLRLGFVGLGLVAYDARRTRSRAVAA